MSAGPVQVKDFPAVVFQRGLIESTLTPQWAAGADVIAAYQVQLVLVWLQDRSPD